ncbi:hypothetical protein TNCV_3430101 [Trichonephila clavipes]|nr:hypothetical protein TNCV_3430101 [Trichonephila clavipes]
MKRPILELVSNAPQTCTAIARMKKVEDIEEWHKSLEDEHYTIFTRLSDVRTEDLGAKSCMTVENCHKLFVSYALFEDTIGQK